MAMLAFFSHGVIYFSILDQHPERACGANPARDERLELLQ